MALESTLTCACSVCKFWIPCRELESDTWRDSVNTHLRKFMFSSNAWNIQPYWHWRHHIWAFNYNCICTYFCDICPASVPINWRANRCYLCLTNSRSWTYYDDACCVRYQWRHLGQHTIVSTCYLRKIWREHISSTYNEVRAIKHLLKPFVSCQRGLALLTWLCNYRQLLITT